MKQTITRALIALALALLVGGMAQADRQTLPIAYGSTELPSRISVPIAGCFLLDTTSRVDATGATFVNSQCRDGRGQVVFRIGPDGSVTEVLSGIEGGRGSLDIRPDGWLWLTVATSEQTEVVFYRVPRWVQVQRSP